MGIIYWSVRSLGGKWMGAIVILARYEFHFIREHENLVKHPSNIYSVVQNPVLYCLGKAKRVRAA